MTSLTWGGWCRDAKAFFSLFLLLTFTPFAFSDAGAPLNSPDNALSSTGNSNERTAGYQVGAFLDQAHAENLLKKLGERDFYGEIHTKTVKEQHYWVVVVPASDIPFENIQQKLLDAGYSSLPITKSEWNSFSAH
jgi:hypothetical protein